MKNPLFLAYLAVDRQNKTPYTAECEFYSNRGSVCLLWGRETYSSYPLRKSGSRKTSIFRTYPRVTNRGMCTGEKLMMSPRSLVAVCSLAIIAMRSGLRTARRCLASPTIHSRRKRTSSSLPTCCFAGCGFVQSANGGGR
jgi:hypothetical protein